MAKRKKLKKLLKVLGAGAAIAGLGRAFMNRNARASTNADAIKAMTSNAAYSGSENVPTNIGKETVDVPNLDGGRFRTRNRITDSAGNTIGTSKADYVQRAKDAANARAMRAFRSNNAYRGNMMTTPDSIIQGMDPLMVSAKKGGRIVKGKKTAVRTGAAKRGFGRAFKGGKK